MTTQTHTGFEVSKRLKEFLGNSATRPMDEVWYACDKGLEHISSIGTMVDYQFSTGEYSYFPAYQLHDLLSRPFCEAMVKRQGIPITEKRGGLWKNNAWFLSQELHYAYHLLGGLPAVQSVLTEMMNGK